MSFDLGLLEEIHGSTNQNNIYNTTCTATVKVGYGEACDDYLREGNIDCSAQAQNEVFMSANGRIQFLLTSSADSTRVIIGLLIAGASSLMLIQ